MKNYAVQNSTVGFYIFADDSSALGTGKTGLTISCTLSKSGGAATSVSPTSITEIGNGNYHIVPTSAHRNTLGYNLWQFSASGATILPYIERIGLADPDKAAFGAVMPTTSGRTLLVDTSGYVTAGTVGDKSGYSLAASQAFNITGNITGNISGSVGSVTGNLGGNVVGSVGSVSGLDPTKIDVAISTRLASASYIAPDNASILLIKAKTDNLPSDPADASDISAAFTLIMGAGWSSSTDTLKAIRSAITSSTVVLNVLPGTDRGIDRGARGQIIVLLQEEITISRSVVDANGSPVDLRSLTLEFVIEDARGNAVATVADADISVGGTDHNSYSFTVPAAASAKLGTFEYALNDTVNKANLALGDWIVKRRAVS